MAFPLDPSFQNGPRRPGFAAPRLTARPGRLRAVLNNLPIKRESQTAETSSRYRLPMVGDDAAANEKIG